MQLELRIISESAKKYFYRPYLKKLDKIKQKIVELNPQVDPLGTEKKVYNWKTPLTYLKRKLLGTHSVYKLRDFSKQ